MYLRPKETESYFTKKINKVIEEYRAQQNNYKIGSFLYDYYGQKIVELKEYKNMGVVCINEQKFAGKE